MAEERIFEQALRVGEEEHTCLKNEKEWKERVCHVENEGERGEQWSWGARQECGMYSL